MPQSIGLKNLGPLVPHEHSPITSYSIVQKKIKPKLTRCSRVQTNPRLP
uniref:Uncharacterized protein n=1 Tax=Arundo donax TaxID=35708 RepID=A0A0A9ADY8_ARUDO